MGQKILIVDDEVVITTMLKRYLESRSYNIIIANDGETALNLAKETRPDIVLSDAQMPGLDGHALCRLLRKDSSTNGVPLILMSGVWVEESNILAGYEEGADDYIIKPLSLPLLVARIESLLRRSRQQPGSTNIVSKCGVDLDLDGRTAKVNGQKIVLTRKEYDLLALLMTKSNRVFSVPQLLENIWGYDPTDYNDPGTVESHVSRLRKKMGPEIAKRIVNVTGYGYKFEDQE